MRASRHVLRAHGRPALLLVQDVPSRPRGCACSTTARTRAAWSSSIRACARPACGRTWTREGTLRCLRALSFPTALSEEIAYAGADDRPGAPDHERCCGRWIHAGSRSPTASRALGLLRRCAPPPAAVDDLIRRQGQRRGWRRLGPRPSSAPRAAPWWLSNSRGRGGHPRLPHLIARAFLTATSLGEALQTAGVLAGHYCDAPALAGRRPTDADSLRRPRDAPARPPSPGCARPERRHVRGRRVARDRARPRARVRAAACTAASSAPRCPNAPWRRRSSRALVTGSHAGTYVDALQRGAVFKTGSPWTPSTRPSRSFVKACGASAAEAAGPRQARVRLPARASRPSARSRRARSWPTEAGGHLPRRVRAAARGRRVSAPPPHRRRARAGSSTRRGGPLPCAVARRRTTVANASTLALSSLRASSSVGHRHAQRRARRLPRRGQARLPRRLRPPDLRSARHAVGCTSGCKPSRSAIREAVAVTLSEDLDRQRLRRLRRPHGRGGQGARRAGAHRRRAARHAGRGVAARLRAADAARGRRRAHRCCSSRRARSSSTGWCPS